MSHARDYLSLGRASLSAEMLKAIDQIMAGVIDAPVSSTPSYDKSVNPNNPPMPQGLKTVSPKDSQPKGDDSVPDSGGDDDKPVKKSEDDGDSPDLYDEVDVQAARKHYPHGTKCPACHSPTTRADVGWGPKVINECASGHQYEARQAIAVRKPEREKQIRDRIKDSSSKNPKSMNPEKGGPASAPNPNNATAPINSDDVGNPPDINKQPWFVGHLIDTERWLKGGQL